MSIQAKNPTLFTDLDIYLFKEGKHYTLYKKLGSHLMEWEQKKGVYFAVWAPNTKTVSKDITVYFQKKLKETLPI